MTINFSPFLIDNFSDKFFYVRVSNLVALWKVGNLNDQDELVSTKFHLVGALTISKIQFNQHSGLGENSLWGDLYYARYADY